MKLLIHLKATEEKDKRTRLGGYESERDLKITLDCIDDKEMIEIDLLNCRIVDNHRGHNHLTYLKSARSFLQENDNGRNRRKGISLDIQIL